VRTVRIGNVAYQNALGDVLDREARIGGIAVGIELVKPDAERADGLQHLGARGVADVRRGAGHPRCPRPARAIFASARRR
jgi:hypothetical protein